MYKRGEAECGTSRLTAGPDDVEGGTVGSDGGCRGEVDVGENAGKVLTLTSCLIYLWPILWVCDELSHEVARAKKRGLEYRAINITCCPCGRRRRRWSGKRSGSDQRGRVQNEYRGIEASLPPFGYSRRPQLVLDGGRGA